MLTKPKRINKKKQIEETKIKQENEKKLDEAPVLSFAQLEGKCYCCGKPGHTSPKYCHSKDIKREDWAINKSQSHGQAGGDISGSLSPPPSVVSEGTVPTQETSSRMGRSTVFICTSCKPEGSYTIGQKFYRHSVL